MRLSKMIGGLTELEPLESDIEVAGLTYDSRQVKPGDLFVAIRGFVTDGHAHVPAAVKAGAVGVVVEERVDGVNVPQMIVEDSRAALANLAAAFYGHPTEAFKLVGVTGTNGKTTTSFMIESIFKAAGFTPGLMGTVECHIGEQVLPTIRTTPEGSDLQRIFREMVDAGVSAAVIEVSSHALDLHRVDGNEFDVAVFTNLSRDHLDYHPTIDDYFTAKSLLFDFPGVRRVVNYDDEYGKKLADSFPGACLRYSTQEEVEVFARAIKLSASGASFEIVTPKETINVNLKLPGAFNVQNALAAAGAGLALGVSLEAIKTGLELLPGVPGRFERVELEAPADVIVDYAHTPDGLEKVLLTAKELVRGKLYCVFGCGGDRDRAKRSLMGEISGKIADVTVITSDNPRSEDPTAIIEEIEEGVRRVPGAVYRTIPDRREAICSALSNAKAGDFVLIAGKGHETGQIFASGILPFDDRLVAQEAAKELALWSR